MHTLSPRPADRMFLCRYTRKPLPPGIQRNLPCQFKSFICILVSWWPAVHKFGEKPDTNLKQPVVVLEITVSESAFSSSILYWQQPWRTHTGTVVSFWASPQGHPLDGMQQGSMTHLDTLTAEQEATLGLSLSGKVDRTSDCLQVLWEDLDKCTGICCKVVKTVVLSLRVRLV